MGGARINAGRKLNPEPRVRILIGAECERLAIEFAEAGALAQYQALMRPTEIDSIQTAVRRVRDSRATEDEQIEAEDATKNIDGLMKDLKQKNPKIGGGFVRAFSIPVRRPKGKNGQFLRKKIAAQVASDFRVALPVAEKCWKEYRRFLKGDPTPWRRTPQSAS